MSEKTHKENGPGIPYKNLISQFPEKISMYDWMYGGVDILKLKGWIDDQVKAGVKTVRVDIEWGYYDDISSLDLVAESPPKSVLGRKQENEEKSGTTSNG